MSNHVHAGSALAPQVIDLIPTTGAVAHPKATAGDAKALGIASFSTAFQWRGNGTVLLNLQHGWINAGSRVFASISEYNTQWNVDRFIGNAYLQVLNVSPYNGGAWVRAAVNWGGPINVSISLLVDP